VNRFAVIHAGVLALGACGTDPVDLTGVYRVDVALGSMPCGTDEPLATFSPFLKLAKDEFLGQSYFKYEGCTDEAGAECTTTGGLFAGFFEPIDDGWRAIVTSSSGASGRCALSYFEQTAILKHDTLVIDGSAFRDEVDLPSVECDPDEAERRGADMPCEEHERFESTRVSD
jgi:hypothetical protein